METSFLFVTGKVRSHWLRWRASHKETSCRFTIIEVGAHENLRIYDASIVSMASTISPNIPAHRGRRPEELIAISGSLTLLSNITIAWMTLHMQEVINRWKREEGRHIDPELLGILGLPDQKV